MRFLPASLVLGRVSRRHAIGMISACEPRARLGEPLSHQDDVRGATPASPGVGGGGIPRTRGDLGEASPRLTEPLSQSEIRVLRYLPTNLSAREIARELSVSLNTVRTHMRHIFAKLGVHHRTEAVTQARALGLLAPSSRTP